MAPINHPTGSRPRLTHEVRAVRVMFMLLGVIRALLRGLGAAVNVD